MDYDFVPKLTTKPGLSSPLQPGDGIARAIALFDFRAVQVSLRQIGLSDQNNTTYFFQPGDLSFVKGDVITVTEKSDNTDTWYVG